MLVYQRRERIVLIYGKLPIGVAFLSIYTAHEQIHESNPPPHRCLGTNITEKDFADRLSREIPDNHKSYERDDQFNNLLII